jgi:hypothetical protein
MENKLVFKLELNGNIRQVSITKADDDSYVVNLENVETAVVQYKDRCWQQVHGSKLPQHFINELGEHIESAKF